MRGDLRTRGAALLLACLLLAGVNASAQSLSGIPGAWADIGLGVRPLGMGGAYSAVAAGEDAARWNPAALALNPRWNAGFTWTNQMGLVPYNYVALSAPLRRAGVGSYLETSGDDVLRENTLGIAAAVGLDRITGRRSLDRIFLGITPKLRWAEFGGNASEDPGQVVGDALGYGLDIGLLWDGPLFEPLAASLVARDLVNDVTWQSSVSGRYSEGVPIRLVAGLAFRAGRRGLLTADFQPGLYGDVPPRLAVGGEYRLLKVLSLRAGAAQNLEGRQLNRDLTLGLGVEVPLLRSAVLEGGLAWLFDELANTPRVGMRVRW